MLNFDENLKKMKILFKKMFRIFFSKKPVFESFLEFFFSF